ncbi:hypothetical protein GCM10010112_18830 [Actinoplanes lobatus]|uniref:Uncharacterized protein n=1 Tax=Actinoplanes lobatus TaxID=113568 RepID=A0A7W7H975_9ACTN|nr:hypothetical protein [Actinoplanes lobatus]MBB4746157.1 hypothetical protein [Actinoplanes lobatus]GGN61576.1 hypothetical protein GCM10010112_18830 [Actinoplanes lobatus]GIE41366.1 hypothetical protein Alo02nite_42640 [Actinoplanes lobatus]
MDVVAQWVSTEWTKRSRGGPGAARRNAVPVGFRLPGRRSGVVHEVSITERNDFVPVESIDVVAPEREPAMGRSGLRLVRADKGVRVELLLARHGAPGRDRRPPGVWLGPGQWLRWQVNYRMSWPLIEGGRWEYRQDTLNLAVGPADPELFFGEPTRHVDERGFLR